MDLTILSELGFSNGEIKVYSALLTIGQSTLNGVQEKTSIERRNIYDILNKLIDKGLVSYIIEKGKKSYRAVQPSKLKALVKEKQSRLIEIENKLPQIQDMYDSQKSEVSVELYRGNDAIKSLLNEILEYSESFWMGGNSFESYSAVPKNIQVYFDHWMSQRVEKKHVMHDLVSYGTHLKGLNSENLKKHKKLFYKFCELPKGIYVPMVIIIFGNKVAQVQWGDQSFAIITESTKVKESYTKYFSHFWRNPW